MDKEPAKDNKIAMIALCVLQWTNKQDISGKDIGY